MAVNEPLSNLQMGRQEERASKAIATGSGAEIIGAGAGIVLSILALVGILPAMLAAVALIALGAGLFFESAAVAANVRIVSQESVANRPREAELLGGLTLAMIGAVATVALGILSLVGIIPGILLAAGAITVGATAIVAGAERERVGRFSAIEVATEREVREGVPIATYAASRGAAGLELLAGVAAVVLGILALVGVNPAVMVLTALLVVASGMFLSSAALTGRMSRIMTH